MSSVRILRWMLVAPALLFGAFVYWTLALGLGALSFSTMRGMEGLDLEMLDAEAPEAAEEGDDVGLDAPSSDVETISVDVVGSHEYTPGLTAF